MSTIQTAKPAPASSLTSRISNSVWIWLALVGFLFLVKLLLMFFYPNAFAAPEQAALFGWGPLAIFSVLGLVGVLLAERTGFAPAWPAGEGVQSAAYGHIILPVLVGLAAGGLMVLLDVFTHFTATINAAHGIDQQYTGFMPMLLAFSAAAIIVEVVNRLFIIPLLLFLISNLLLRGRWQEPVFWVLAIVLSAYETTSSLGILSGWVLWANIGLIYAVNLVQAAFFRKYGFLSAILIRVAFYLVWHAIYIH